MRMAPDLDFVLRNLGAPEWDVSDSQGGESGNLYKQKYVPSLASVVGGILLFDQKKKSGGKHTCVSHET